MKITKGDPGSQQDHSMTKFILLLPLFRSKYKISKYPNNCSKELTSITHVSDDSFIPLLCMRVKHVSKITISRQYGKGVCFPFLFVCLFYFIFFVFVFSVSFLITNHTLSNKIEDCTFWKV